MSKGLAIIGIALGAIVAGVLTFGAGTALVAAGATVFGTALTAGMVSAAAWGVGGLLLVGGTLSTVASWSGGSGISQGSPTYSWGKLQTQTSNCLAIPIIYGECKVAGNTIWQDGAGTATLKKIIALSDGEIEAIGDVKINNKAIGSLSGCSHNAYLGTETQIIDSRVKGANNIERAKLIGGLRKTAYVAITAQASAELSGGVNLTTVVKGSKVKVYPGTTAPEVKYSNNPAWCILDFLTRYNGCGIPLEELDLLSFTDAANYCDQEITNEDGEKQPRFTLNLVMDEKKSRLDWLENMLIACRGYTYYQNGKLALKIEQAEPVMQLFDKDNILAGSESFWTTPREKKIDVFKVQYIDPTNEYARIFAHATADEFENEQPIVQEVQAWGVTNFNQASRLAWFYLNQAKTCDKFISFKTSQEGLDRTVGDVIEISSTFLGYEKKKMRIVHLAEAQEGQIDIVCKEYNEDLYTDKLGSGKPVVNTITLPSVFDIPPTPKNLTLEEYGYRTPEGNHVASIIVNYDLIDYFHLSHYEISYSNNSGETWEQGKVSYDNSYTIQNVQVGEEYLVRVQSVTSRNIFSEPAEGSITLVGKNNPPENVKEFVLLQKENLLKVVITPPDEPDIDYYEIRKGLTWEDSDFICKFYDKTTTFRPDTQGTVSYLIKVVDNVGNYSINAVRTVVNVSGIAPKNIIIDQTFEIADFLNGDSENEILLPIMDMGVNFEDYRSSKETCLRVILDNLENSENYEVIYRSGFANFEGWDYVIFDENTWEDDTEINWSPWKTITAEPAFTGQYLQAKIRSKSDGVYPDSVQVIADVEDVEDIVYGIEIPAKTTTISLNKNFTIPPSVTPITADATGKVCAWRVSNIKKRNFDIELLDKDDNLIEGKLLSAVARGY